MGGQSNMGGAATPQTTPTQGIPATGMPSGGGTGGFDLSKLFMGNQATNPAGGGQQLPQIQAPARQPMPTMPARTPMPQMQVDQTPQVLSRGAQALADVQKNRDMRGQQWRSRRTDAGRR